jgi:hypothetical protein
MARNASKHAALRSQRTTKRRYCFWNQAKVRSAWHRGTTFLLGLPRCFFVFQTRFGSCARRPRFRNVCRNALASYPLSVAMTWRRLRGRPRWPVRTLTASSRGPTWARASPLAGVVRFAQGIPLPSVRRWRSIPWPCPPWAPPAPPPFPGGNSASHGARLPTNHPTLCSNTEHPRVHGGQGPIGLPPLPPAMRRTLGGPLRPARRIAPATTRNQDGEQGMEDLPKRHMRHPTPTLRRCWRKNVRKQAPLQIT